MDLLRKNLAAVDRWSRPSLLGFVALAAGRLSVGPLLLVGGYCVLLPFFLWRSFRRRVGE